MNMHAERLNFSGSQHSFSSRVLADAYIPQVRPDQTSRLHHNEKTDVLNEGYLPPKGIDPKPFEGLSRSDFFVKVPEKSQTDPHLLLQCAHAVQDTSEYLHEFSSKGVVESIMTEQEVVDHLEIYTEEAIEAASILNSQIGNVAVVASPVGGIPPLHAVMERASDNPDLANQISFVPLSKNKPNLLALEAIKKAKGFVHIDDGATLMTDQALLLEQLEEDPRWVQYAINEIKRIKKHKGTCMDDEQIPLYEQLIEGFANHNMVLAPLYTKNPLFFRMLGDVAGSRNDAWAMAQQGILERSILIIPERKTAVGSMIKDIPCRDKGVTLHDLLKEKIVDPKVEQLLHQGGLSNIDFRLFSNIKSLESINHAFDPFLHGLFADQLRYRVLKNH